MSTILTTFMQRALRELDVGIIVPTAYVSAFAAGSFTAANFWQNTNLGGADLLNRQAGIYRNGAATSADSWRPAGVITNSSGVVTQVGASWADTTVGTEDIEIWYWRVRRDQEVLAALNRIMEFEFVTSMHAISHLSQADGDMALSTDSDWTNIGSPSTSAKATTAGVTPWGMRSYHLVNAGASDGTRSASIRVRQSGIVTMHAIGSAEIGTVSLQPYDNTNSVAYGTAVTHSERRPQLMTIRGQAAPETCKLTSMNLTNTSASGDHYWDGVWLFNHDDLLCRLPPAVSESFQAPVIFQARPTVNTGTGTYDAGSFDMYPLVEGHDYWFVINHADAEPYKVRFADNSYYQWPLFVEVRRPLSDLTTFSAESDSTTGPLHKNMPRFKKELLETVYNTGVKRHPDWATQHNLATAQLTTASIARPIKSVAKVHPYYSGPSRM